MCFTSLLTCGAYLMLTASFSLCQSFAPENATSPSVAGSGKIVGGTGGVSGQLRCQSFVDHFSF